MRLGAELPGRPSFPPFPPEPVSVAQLYTLTSDASLSTFDVSQLPLDLIVQITLLGLHTVDQSSLDRAVNNVKSRYAVLGSAQQAARKAALANSSPDDEDDDYEPMYQEDAEQILNKDEALEDSMGPATDLALGPFVLPQPPALTSEKAREIGTSIIQRVFGKMVALDDASTTKRPKPGLNRLAGSNHDREAWITILTRMATRAPAGLEEQVLDDKSNQTALANGTQPTLGDGIRETLWKYVLEDFRARIPTAIAWLNEEWYNDCLQAKANEKATSPSHLPRYEKWLLKIIDGILPYLDAKDKALIRFLSEIPAINDSVLERVKRLARDPERVGLAVNTIQ